MKKIVLTLFSTIALLNCTNAQVSAYTFAQSAGTYTAITGGTLVARGSTPDDNVYGALNIGFTFNYNNLNYTQFGLNVNGWISMGATAPTSSYLPISGGTTNNIISSLGRDLQLGFTTSGASTTGSNIITNIGSVAGFAIGDTLYTATGFAANPVITAVGTTTITVSTNATSTQTAGTYTTGGTIRYQTTGTSPNRVCVIQWSKARRYGTSLTGTNAGQNNLFNFQIRLTETTNTINFVYGTFQTNATSSVYQIGLRGGATTDFNNRKTTTDWSATTAGTVNTDTCRLTTTVKPTSGQTYTYTPPPACTGMPTAGTASAPTAACSGVAFNLTLTGYSTNSGLTFQWQSSTTSGGTYTNITGGTTPVFSTTQTSALFYKCVVTCTGSSQSMTSNIVNVTMNTALNCYCVAVHGTVCSTSDNIDSVRIVSTTLANLHTGCTGTNGNAYTIYPATGSTTASLQAGNSYTFKITTTTNNIISVWIDYNQNGMYDSVEWKQVCTTSAANVANTVSITIPASATAGVTGMRIRSRLNGNINGPSSACTSFGSGETEDYKVTIIAATPCTGTPTAGTASAPASVCTGTPFTLTLTGYTSGASGLTFQWKSSTTSGGTYTNITGATTPVYTTTQTAALFYECVVTCTASSQSATSTPINVTMTPPTGCYCTSTATDAADEDIFNVTVGTLNNSSTCATTGGTGSTLNEYSNYTSVAAPNLAKGASVSFSVQIGTCGTGSYQNAFKIYIDYNQNGSFAEAGERVFQSDTVAGAHTKTGTFTVPTAATLGNTRMRVVLNETTSPSSIDSCGTYTWGETEDYTVNITAATGIAENALGTISIYPNPTTGLFNIIASNANFNELAINVFDIQGKEVFSILDKNSSVNYNKQINLEGLSKGLYYIKLNTGNGAKTQKLIIQ